MNINERLTLLRTQMQQYGLQAYIIPSSDPHQSEYVADFWKSREWISGFTGSAGVVAVCSDHAGLWTDSRYFIQAEQELSSSEFVLHKQFNQFAPSHIDWLCNHLNKGDTVGVDGWLFSKSQIESYRSILSKHGISLQSGAELIDHAWKDRPALPNNIAFDHKVKYNGEHRENKIARVQAAMRDKGSNYHLVTTLDDLAWIFNIRSNDVEFNPVFISYAVIGEDSSTIFADSTKLDNNMINKLAAAKVQVKDYKDIKSFLEALPTESTILVDKTSCNTVLYDAISCEILLGDIPSRLMKAIKNETEQTYLRKVMVKDGVALANTFYWLEQNLGVQSITEFDLSEKLAEYRSQQDLYFGESFAAIVGYKGNGAIIHYRPMKDTAATIERDGVLLVDSGGQYQDGTTDITRTFALSRPSEEEKDAYTRVLKGHIALAKAIFPEKTLGVQLDTFARHALWENGLNYLHGTGHGVGFFLNVHEPPQGFTAGLSGRSRTSFEPGMYTSNEPGYYKEGAFGIRIENLVITQKSRFDGFLEHETITLYPIDKTLIDSGLLSKDELRWLNEYHRKVFEKLSPHLEQDVRVWLEKQCTPLN